MALLFGALASRSVGIYFLMITLTYSVIANLFFGQVTDVSGFGGISGIPAPSAIGNVDAHPNRLYYVALVVALARLRAAALHRAHAVRPDAAGRPRRPGADGVARLQRRRSTARSRSRSPAFIAAIGGVLFVWWNGHIDPASIDLGATIDLLVIAVIGGLYRLEGAWVGALFFVIINNYSQRIGFIGPRFHTLIGAIFLVIVLVSPGGLVGLWERVVDLLLRARRGPLDRTPVELGPGRAQRLKGGLARDDVTASTAWRFARFDDDPINGSKGGGQGMGSGMRRRKLIPFAVLAVLGAAIAASAATATSTATHDQGRRAVGLSGSVRLVRRSGPRGRRLRDVAVRRREAGQPERSAQGLDRRLDQRPPAQARRHRLLERQGRHGDQGDEAPHGAVGRGRHDRPALG